MGQTSESGRVGVYLDCDTGIDDAMALLYLHHQPAVDLLGVGTVSGNVASDQAALNTLALLELVGSETPVAVGERDHLTHPYAGGSAAVHGQTGTGNVRLRPERATPHRLDAPDLLIDLARAHRGELKVIATGPLTNLAVALRREPDLPNLVSEVTIMGGAACGPGNVTPAAEANIANDPEAAAAVFGAGWPLTMVGLDVTMQHRLTDDHRARLLAGPHRPARCIGRMLDTYLSFYVGIFGAHSCALHDPLAAAVGAGLVRPVLAPTVEVAVETGHGPGRGRTIADLRDRFIGYPPQPHANCRVVLAVPDGFAEELVDVLLQVRAASP
ncbi:MAG TPA: nucleoside hydrolase [Trebonia sp.]